MYIERIKNLRVDNDISQDKIAKYLQIAQNTYSQYENDTRHFPIEYIIKLAEFYNTSVDYLLGLTNQNLPYPRAKLGHKK